jgi:hypothetical protein
MFCLPVCKIVDSNDVVAGVQEFDQTVGSNVAGTSGHKYGLGSHIDTESSTKLVNVQRTTINGTEPIEPKKTFERFWWNKSTEKLDN